MNDIASIVLFMFSLMILGLVMYIPYLIINKLARGFAKTAHKTYTTIRK